MYLYIHLGALWQNVFASSGLTVQACEHRHLESHMYCLAEWQQHSKRRQSRVLLPRASGCLIGCHTDVYLSKHEGRPVLERAIWVGAAVPSACTQK